jgi:16S rRNA (guanine966-N2)-methyltransferase
MRVVAGELRGRKLVAPAGETTRPTTDKVRQAVFNSLESMGVVADAEVLDLFAGSGAMGIEALSRGAAHCTFVERDRAAVVALRANISALGLADRSTVVVADVWSWPGIGRPCDLAIVDPPYAFDAWDDLLARIDAPYVVCEAAREVAASEGRTVLRSRGYGRTTVTLLGADDDEE